MLSTTHLELAKARARRRWRLHRTSREIARTTLAPAIPALMLVMAIWLVWQVVLFVA